MLKLLFDFKREFLALLLDHILYLTVHLLKFSLDFLVFHCLKLLLVFLKLLLHVVSDRFLLLATLPLLLLVGKEHFAVSLPLSLPIDLGHLL